MSPNQIIEDLEDEEPTETDWDDYECDCFDDECSCGWGEDDEYCVYCDHIVAGCPCED